MKVLIIGGGGREHALAWAASRSPQVTDVFVAPGNGGTATEPGLSNVAIEADDVPALVNFATRTGIDLTIVGPEVPLVKGVCDRFAQAGLPCFGPCADAARLEGSKAFMKAFLTRHNIPTAQFEAFTELAPALAHIDACEVPVVVKADGLAAGKGVVVAGTRDEAREAVTNMLQDDAFGEAGHRVIIEQFLEGEEASFIAMVDGQHILPLATSQDHKARDNGDQGPNTGGMGAYSPAPVVTPKVHAAIMEQVMRPTVQGLSQEGSPYVGFLYAGVMVAPDGSIKVLEFNCRFGDPETQPVLMRLRSDLVDLCQHALRGTLDQCSTEWDPRPALGVVLAAGGYPGKYHSGDVITGIPPADVNRRVFHAGTQLDDNGRHVTAGGRVLCAVALGDTVREAQRNAYALVDAIQWKDVYCRTDIGYRAIAREAD